MKKVTKRALSLAVTTLLLMNTFSITAFANNGHGYGHENNKDWFENGHDNRDHAKQHEQELEQNDEQEQPEIEILIDELEEEELQEEEIQQEESEEEEIPAEEAQEEAAEEEIQQEESEEEETPAEEAQEEAVEEIVEEFEQIEAVEEEAEEEVEEAEAEAEPEEEPWRSYTLYNYISVNNGKTYISLNTQEDGITNPKTAAEFHRENNNKKYNLEGYEYEIEDYDLTELVYTENGISYVEKSVAAKGQPYFTA